MTTIELYTKGARVWISHPETVWEGAELLENFKTSQVTLQVITENNIKKTLNIKKEQDLPPLRNPQILIGGNDLTSLSFLHEPAVIYNLQIRFCEQKNIYTYCGIILVAINPYDELPIYDIDTMYAYKGQSMGDLNPHIFAVAEEAYTKLEREQRNQSIIISGESGSGKTVSAKYIMRYFATVGGNATETQVEKNILASSPIMEAMGNAKTTRNDNSSRFGKFIELQFNDQYRICGASLRTYLLEKSRVVFQSEGDRNYHMLYQLCSAKDEWPDLYLGRREDFHYLNQGFSPYIDGVDDYEKYQETLTSFKNVGFSLQEISNIFKILSVILHLGNLQFKDGIHKTEDEGDIEGCAIEEEDGHLEALSNLLEISADSLSRWLTIRKIVTVRETLVKPMTAEDAETSRDALAKHLYAEIFNWIVRCLNAGIESNENKTATQKFIGVLDIYGFETFERNSFEQFCINYANEKLQQQFYSHVFKLEQDEYIKEEIEWKMIDFYDNQPCIDLIEHKLGILDLLDEECKMPRGSDRSWTEKLYNKCAKYSQFGKAKFGETAFNVTHFADKVQYESEGFLEKNRDTVYQEHIEIIRQSNNKFISKLFCEDSERTAPPGTRVKIKVSSSKTDTKNSNKKTVGNQFRESLNSLMATLNATTPYYVRCIKPNDNKKKFEYNPSRAAQQLKACGVLETIRLSAAGFPSRWLYYEFFRRYRVLCKFKDINRESIRATCENIIRQHITNSGMYQFGRSKIFFRASQVAYLEKLRADKLRRCCIMMQKTVRAFICRKRYVKLRRSVLLLQKYGRGYLGRRLANNIRRTRASIIIQKNVRCWLQRLRYRKIRKTVLGIQTHCRGFLSRKRYLALKYNAKATIIQKHWRGWLARKNTRIRMKNLIVCQAAVRRFLAKRKYKKLKIEARSIEHVKGLNKGLENKIISLQQKIDKLQEKNSAIEKTNANSKKEIAELRNKMVTAKALEIEIKNLNTLLIEKNKLIEKQELKLKSETDEKMDIIHELEQLKQTMVSENREKLKLLQEIDKSTKAAEMSEKSVENRIKDGVEMEKLLFLNEKDVELHAYQKLLQENNELKQRCREQEIAISDIRKRGLSDSGIESTKLNEGTPEQGLKYDETNTTKSDKNLDIGLLLKLQRKIAQLQREKVDLQNHLNRLESSAKKQYGHNAAQDSLKLSELEIQNATLKAQICELQNSITEGDGKSQLLEHLRATQDDLERRTEEIIQLKSVLVNQTDNIKSIVNAENDAGFMKYINEDAELALAYETQKLMSKQLEKELQDEKDKFETHVEMCSERIKILEEENEKYLQILNAHLSDDQNDTKQVVYLRNETARIISENLELQNLNDKLKKQNKRLSEKLKEANITLEYSSGIDSDMDATLVPCMKNLKKQDREYLGMFTYPAGQEKYFMKKLVTELKPRTAITLLPCLPAYIMFMCIRHTDFVNDEKKVKSLLSTFLNSVKKLLRGKQDDFETSTLWLANTLRLLHNMKQYSGDTAFQQKNTPKQNEKCLRNFDLSEYRQVLSDVAVWIYQALVSKFTKTVQPLIIPCILEHEEVQGIGGSIPGLTKSTLGSTKAGSPSQKPTVLLQEFSNYHKILNFYGVDAEVISQIFKQVTYYLCAASFNNLLVRNDLCHWSKGIQIRHNLSHFEGWIRDKKLDDSCTQVLQPIIQASQLLQARKENDEDVKSICDMCSVLSSHQINKILTLYYPVDDFEERVSKAFIQKVLAELQRRNTPEQPTLMDTTFQFPVRFPYKPSDICLENVEVPEVLELDILEKL